MQKITPITLSFILLTCLYILPTHHAAVQTKSSLEQPAIYEPSLREQTAINSSYETYYIRTKLLTKLAKLTTRPYDRARSKSLFKTSNN